jgi:hypothetical protein
MDRIDRIIREIISALLVFFILCILSIPVNSFLRFKLNHYCSGAWLDSHLHLTAPFLMVAPPVFAARRAGRKSKHERGPEEHPTFRTTRVFSWPPEILRTVII